MVQSLYDVILGDDDEHYAVLLLLFAYGVIGGSRRQVSQLAAWLGLPQSLQFSVMSGWARGYVMCELSLFIAIAQPPCISISNVTIKRAHATDLQSLLVGQGAPPERVVLDAARLHLEPLLLVLPLRRARLRSGEDPGAFWPRINTHQPWLNTGPEIFTCYGLHEIG